MVMKIVTALKGIVAVKFASPRVLPCEQRLQFRGMSCYFSHASSYRENVVSARRVPVSQLTNLRYALSFSY